MVLHVSVILFTGGSVSLHAGIHPCPPWSRGRHPPPRTSTPREQTPPGSRHTPRSRHPPAQCMLGDMGNKRTVRILLAFLLSMFLKISNNYKRRLFSGRFPEMPAYRKSPDTEQKDSPCTTNTAETPALSMSTVDKYRAGFNACASEIQNFLSGTLGVDPEIRMRVLDHLANHVQNLFWIKFNDPGIISTSAGSSRSQGRVLRAMKLKQMVENGHRKQRTTKNIIKEQLKFVNELIKQGSNQKLCENKNEGTKKSYRKVIKSKSNKILTEESQNHVLLKCQNVKKIRVKNVNFEMEPKHGGVVSNTMWRPW